MSGSSIGVNLLLQILSCLFDPSSVYGMIPTNPNDDVISVWRKKYDRSILIMLPDVKEI